VKSFTMRFSCIIPELISIVKLLNGKETALLEWQECIIVWRWDDLHISNYMKHSICWKANSCSPGKDIPSFLYKENFVYPDRFMSD
jgi:hypothetical protein